MGYSGLSLDDVSVVRAGKRILTDIKWVVMPGEKWVVFGPNGSGKTSLLKLICGYLWPTEGTVSVLGHRFGYVNLQELRQRIGWVGPFLQEFIPPYQTPREIIRAGKLGIAGRFTQRVPIDYDRDIENLSRLVGCFEFLDHPYGPLSQGEKQRVLLARALVCWPNLLILDEPCDGLDIIAREVFLKILEKLAVLSKDLTGIYVTHHLEEITSFFTKMLILKQGKIIAAGEIEEVVTEENLSTVFDVPVKIMRENGRFWLQCDLTDFSFE